MRSHLFSVYDLDRILRAAGAQRVCESAVFKLGDILEDQTLKIIERAREYALHAKRHTIKRSDIELAAT